MGNTIQSLYDMGQSIWCDNLSRRMLDAGELRRWIDQGVGGVTSNPTILMKAVTGTADYDRLFDTLLRSTDDLVSLYEGLVLPDIADAADTLRPVYDRTHGVDGYVSLEVNPRWAADTQATIDEARRLFTNLNRPNVMIKVPATDQGIPAVETLIGEGINVNVTLIFSPAMYEKVMQAYLAGLKRRRQSGGDLSTVSSVASFFVSRLDAKVDAILEARREAGEEVDALLGRAAVANARLAYARFEQVFDEAGAFGGFARDGARVQRPLWASTSTKNPAYSPTKYIDSLVAPRTVNTLPPPTIQAVMQQDSAAVTIRDEITAARDLFRKLDRLDIDMAAITDQLLIEGVDAFAKSFEDLLANLAGKQQKVRATG